RKGSYFPRQPQYGCKFTAQARKKVSPLAKVIPSREGHWLRQERFKKTGRKLRRQNQRRCHYANEAIALARISHSLAKIVASAARPAVLRASRPSEPSPNPQLSVVAQPVRNAG